MKSFKTGETVQVWDYILAGKDRDDTLNGHGQVGVIIRKSRKSDVSDTGLPLEERAKGCYLVALPGLGLCSVHREWLRSPENKKNKKRFSNDNNYLQH